MKSISLTGSHIINILENMRVPFRKSETYLKPQPDPYVTPAKFGELQAKLDKFRQQRPQAALEVRRLAEMGDFSENAGYQLAKSRLRGINNRILELEHQLKHAIILDHNLNNHVVKLGHTVIVRSNHLEKTYTILGSTETDPAKGIISHNSPIGKALLNHAIGDTVIVELADKELILKVIDIL